MEIKWGDDLSEISIEDLEKWIESHRYLEYSLDPETLGLWGSVFGYAWLSKIASKQNKVVEPRILAKNVAFKLVSIDSSKDG